MTINQNKEVIGFVVEFEMDQVVVDDSGETGDTGDTGDTGETGET